MKLQISKPFASNSPVDEYDVHQVKRVLNRLGYYTPPKNSGTTGIPDREMFIGLEKFQKAQKLRITGTMKPGDDTEKALNDAQEKQGGSYIWHTMGDNKVRPEHAAREGQIFLWDSPPEGGNPGEDYNCRCWAEPIKDAIKPVYPELLLIPASRIGSIIKIISEFYRVYKTKNYTGHGNFRSGQRDISFEEIQEAIKSAKKTGNVIQKIGKYGTIQNRYKGSNGITVIEETAGRNAGKIITVWHSK